MPKPDLAQLWSRLLRRVLKLMSRSRSPRITDSKSQQLTAKATTKASHSVMKNLTPTATALLRILAFLDGDSVSEEMLIRWQKMATLSNYPFSRDEYLQARDDLIGAARVTWGEHLSTLKIERAVQDKMRQKLNAAEFRKAFNTAAMLVAAMWPAINFENMCEMDWKGKITRYLPHVKKLREVLEERGVEGVRPRLVVAALFNEASWAYQLPQRGFCFEIGGHYATLAQRVAEESSENDEYSEQFRSKILSDCYRHQGVIGGHLGNQKGLLYTKKWIEILVQRRVRYWQEKGDELALPVAYNDHGRALMWVPDKAGALRMWEVARDKVLQNKKDGELPFPLPWINGALVHAYDGKTTLAEHLILPILKEREKVLGRDDTETFETGLILICVGNIRRTQRRNKEAYAFFQRAAKVVPNATGKRSIWSIQAYYRLAVEEFEQGNFTEARDLLVKVVDFVGDSSSFEAVAARGKWKLGKTLVKLGGGEHFAEARVLLEQAYKVRKKLAPSDAEWGRPVG